MEVEQRKEKFIALLNELLTNYNGVKIKLAKKLEINSSTLTRWLQGKIDPACLDSINFVRLAEIANISSDELAQQLGISSSSEENVFNKFKYLVKGLLSSQSMEELGRKLGVTYGAINGWVSSQKKINPERIPIGTIAALAKEKEWTLEKLLVYLGLKKTNLEKNLLFELQSGVNVLSLSDQVKLLSWLSDSIEEKVTKRKIVNNNNKTLRLKNHTLKISIIIEIENLSLTSHYANNLGIHFQIPADNIMIATITQFEEVKEGLDLIIFDIETNSSNTIELIKQISFDGDIVIFTSQDLEAEVRSQLEDKVTDIVAKPIDWNSLKDKPYFMDSESKGLDFGQIF